MPRLKVALVAKDAQETLDRAARQLEEASIDLVERLCETDEQVAVAAADADVVWVFGGSRVVTPRALERLDRCGMILRTGTGTDNIPVDAATRLGMIVANTPEACAAAVAEHAVGLLFAVARRIAVLDRAVRNGIWDGQHAPIDCHITGQTIGLIGFGRIGRLVARMVRGMDMRVLATDPAVDADAAGRAGAEVVTLEALLETSDFISIHVPLLDQTRRLIGERELRACKPNAILINTSRGPVVDEQALVRALTEGWIGGAGLDVLEHEPPAAGHPLLLLDNVVLTPHVAADFDGLWEAFWDDSVRTLIEVSKRRWPLWCVNPEVKSRWERI